MSRFPDCLGKYEREFYDASTPYHQTLIRSIYRRGSEAGFPAGYDYAHEVRGETTAFSDRYRQPTPQPSNAA